MIGPSRCCRICGSEATTVLNVKELMFGTREVFDYLQCANCGCVQIAQVPNNLSVYYPANYYSFGASRATIKSNLKNAVRVAALRFPWTPSVLLDAIARRDTFFDLVRVYQQVAKSRHASVLDVGSGAGRSLDLLLRAGFHNVTGIDAYLPEDVTYPSGLRIMKADIFGIGGSYDIISFNHSLEHMTDQGNVLKRARELLSVNGRIIVRIPIVGGIAWEMYKEDWVQFDAPRHLFLHSAKSLNLLAAQAGLCVSKLTYDSTGFQFWGSELYRRGIPLAGFQWPPARGATATFTAREMANYRRKAREANEACAGDQVTAVLESNS